MVRGQRGAIQAIDWHFVAQDAVPVEDARRRSPGASPTSARSETMQIDTSSEFGARVARRLADDQIGWLTTVGKDGTPHPRPVWFLPQGDDVLIYSLPNTAKLAHLARNPRASLNLDGDGHGGNIVVLTGAARVDESLPPAHEIPEYVAKYRDGMARVTGSPEGFAAAYSVPIRFTPEKLSGH